MNIDGLRWEDTWTIPNGGESSVHPIPSLRPTTIVYHGDEDFSYGHYGIHLGQEDILTFLGRPDLTITGRFIDCREGSPTEGAYETFTWSPSSRRRLHIPPGVAHALDNLGGVNTLNTYRSYLPSPEALVHGDTAWSPDTDIVNLPDDCTPEDAPRFVPNTYPASEGWYQLVARIQGEALSGYTREYPMTADLRLDSGEDVRVKLARRLQSNEVEPTPACEIPGVMWEPHLHLPSGENSGFVPLVDRRPMYYIDHGTSEYTHDAYGIHCYQEDRLTFLGESTSTVRVHMFDARENSATAGLEDTFEFQPNARRVLAIPPGVAHAFEHLENVFTVNRPKSLRVPEKGAGFEFPDVIDWPLDKLPRPTFPVGSEEVDISEYLARVTAQEEEMANPGSTETPAVLLVDDGEGGNVRVALRKRVEA